MENIKVSPKFKTQFLGDAPPDDPRIKELKRWCEEFSARGLMPIYGGGAFGNLSFRSREGLDEFIITASGLKDPSDDDSFVGVSAIDLDQLTVYARGKRPPSSESMLHYLIYKKRKDVNAIFHGHCKKILDHYKELGIPCTLKEEPYGTIELAQGILDALDDHPFLVMKNHGFISIAENMDKAGERAIQIIDKL